MTSIKAQRTAFTLGLLVACSAILGLTLRLGPMARLVPMSIVVPCLVLLVVQLAADLSAGRRRHPNETGAPAYSLDWLRERVHATLASGDDKSEQISRAPGDELAAVAAVAALPLSIYLLGFFAAVPLYALAYVRLRCHESWPVTAAVAACVWALPFGVVHALLRIPLFEGRLWSWLGL